MWAIGPIVALAVYLTAFESMPWYVSLTGVLICLVLAILAQAWFAPAWNREIRVYQSLHEGEEITDYPPNAKRLAKQFLWWCSAIWILAAPLWAVVYWLSRVPSESYLTMGAVSSVGFALPIVFRIYVSQQRHSAASKVIDAD
jgi:hypothetical protein